MKTSYSNSSKSIRHEKIRGYGNTSQGYPCVKIQWGNGERTFELYLHTAVRGDLGDYILWRGRLLYVAIILYLVAVVKGKKRPSERLEVI